ncbi:MAG: hypothetical protein HN916_08060 [Anaerolineae bacterium]|jgi:hypothetical protein|nr:hypothetical protein [Anaerolineae bacterium]
MSFINKKFLFSVIALVLATLACGLPTPGTPPPEINLEATQLAATIAALQQTPVVAATNAVAPTNTQIPVATAAAPAATATPSKPMLSVSVNTNCRSGPGIKYPITGAILTNGSFEVTAQAPASTPYLIIRNPDGGADCWAWLEHATVAGVVTNLPILPIPPVPVGSISGFVWLEDCDDLNPGNSCIMNNGLPEGDGSFNGEIGISDVPVELFSGACPPTTSVGTTKTSNGSFKFEKLEAGTYCIKVNDSFLASTAALGGTFTFPSRGAPVQTHQVDLLPGKDVSGFNFGWDDFEQ